MAISPLLLGAGYEVHAVKWGGGIVGVRA